MPTSYLPPDPEPLEFECPRCHNQVSERLYGPCSPCRAELRASLGGEQSELVTEDYIPKMNVTPNAVALKE